ncbi:BMP family ABC transporter substrate-binding protein [Oceanispirochaeta sp.]|jgi:basic membrane protein A|uniref:BMP family ABC transporter substrate-binding protein n=1 Tax=Oceanispirochaeta sp. TaxID=2035350 RepID=UPI00262D3AE1|nr:BMP family ABC transporter substrate-binding protein [Oceanispirochaeta sp.]MDA3955824.1 BMP family ABC transporter substrate-binding protein [Oceanispirochaeta sp.]
MKRLQSVLLAALMLLISGMLFAGGAQEAPAAAAGAPAEKKVKAGFVYIGPAGDFGWTYAHDQGRKFAEAELPWLETITVESVPEGDAVRFIDRMVQEQKCDVIFTTSFGYMDDTVAVAAKYPDVKFFHASGFKRSPNMGTYMGDMYQIYYMNGLIAGAMSKSNKIGYVAAFPIPELFRHMNAFALGIKEVNPEATVSAKWIYAWYGPDKAREAAESLIAEGCDVLAFTEDTPTVVEVAQEHQEKGEKIYAMSHYSPMQSYGKDAVLTGQLTDWGVLYKQMLMDYKAGKTDDLTDYDLLWLMKENAVEMGGSMTDKINPKYVETLKGIKTDSADFGSISIYDLVMKRYEQMKSGRDVFDPFTGPIYDQAGNKTIADGEIASIGHLFAEMMYQVDNFDTPLPQ